MASLSAPRPRSKPARFCKLLVKPDGSVPGILDIDVGKQLFSYFVTPLPSDFGQAFRLRKYTPDDGESYDVCLDGERSSCDCLGHLRHGHCKHVESLLALRAAGKL